MAASNIDTTRPIMAICTDSSRCGCAVYVDSGIQLVADRKDSGDPYKGLDIIIQRIDPEVVIVSSAHTRLIDFLEKRFSFKAQDLSKRDNKRLKTSSTQCVSLTQQSSEMSMQIIPEIPDEVSDVNISAFTLAIVPNVWFCMSRGLQKLFDSELVSSKGIVDPAKKLLFITSRVEKSVDVCAIRSISAIDSYIIHAFVQEPNRFIDRNSQTNISSSSGGPSQARLVPLPLTEDARELMPILEIKYVDPGPVLSIDKFTFEALGIFHRNQKKYNDDGQEEDPDPDLDRRIPSLYDLLNQCQSLQGKRQLRTIMLWPLQDVNELTHRHDTLEYFMRPENRLFKEQLMLHLKSNIPLAGILTKLNQSVAKYQDMSKLYKALWSFKVVIDLIKANSGHNIEILNRITNLDSPDLQDSIDKITQVIDFEGSQKERRIQVTLGVDESVDEKKEVVKNLVKFCDEVAIQETTKYKDVLGKTCRVVYIPRIGFLNSVDYTSTSELLQIRSNREFDVLLHTEQSVYFKTPRMDELDKNAGDIACDLIDVQESVVAELQANLLMHSETILELMELCGQLDCLIAFAQVSFQRGYTRPEFTPPEQEIFIQQAYHPLQCATQNIVPNNVRFYKESSERRVKVMVITGPNSCGKTTYMKATCLVAYMAHIGCFVPAIYARMPIVDSILTRMHSANSISTGLSSFATDLHQINYALTRATENSLIAIDEFGRGTRARDGFHLLKGLVIYFAVRSQRSPNVMIATHFNSLINHLQNYSEYILYKTFQVSRDPTKGTVVYEFKMMDGVTEISLADQVALKAGVPARIIDRAKQIRECMTDGRVIRARPPCGA